MSHRLWLRLANWYMRDLSVRVIGRVGWMPDEFDRMQSRLVAPGGYIVVGRQLLGLDEWPGYRRWPTLTELVSQSLASMSTTLSRIEYKQEAP